MSGIQQKISAVLVDDEADACENLHALLSAYHDDEIAVVAIARSTQEAEQYLGQYSPQVLFLDVDMPRENAFSFLGRIPKRDFEVIFVTAYEQYAIKALKLHAVDYLLKPVAVEELKDAVVKLAARMQQKEKTLLFDKHFYQEAGTHFKARATPKRIVLKGENNIEVVDMEQIFFVEARGAYAKFYFAGPNGTVKSLLLSHPISEYEELLDAACFFRVHKSFIVNCRQVSHIDASAQSAVLKNGTYVPVSRRRYADFLHFLKQS